MRTYSGMVTCVTERVSTAMQTATYMRYCTASVPLLLLCYYCMCATYVCYVWPGYMGYFVCIYDCVCVYIHICRMYLFIIICTCLCVYVWICMYFYNYMCIYIYIRIYVRGLKILTGELGRGSKTRTGDVHTLQRRLIHRVTSPILHNIFICI